MNTTDAQGQPDSAADAVQAGATDKAITTEISLPGAVEILAGPANVRNRILQVDPDLILVDQDLRSLRAWTAGTASGASQQELAIPELARLIEEEGQQQPCKVWIPPGGEGYSLVFGHRRREAVRLLRSEGVDVMLDVVVDYDIKTAEQAFRAACIENIHHESFTPVEEGRLVGRLREKFHWQGKKGLVEVARYLGKDVATVSQLERLLTAPADVLAKVQAGTMTKTAALEGLTSPVEVREEVFGRAQEEAYKEARKKGAKKKLQKTTEFVSDAVKNKNRKAKGKGGDAQSTPTTDRSSQQGAPEGDGPVVSDVAAPVSSLTEPFEYAAPCGVCGEKYGHAEDCTVIDEPGETPEETTAEEPARIESRHVRKAQREVEGAMPRPKAMKMADALDLIEPWTGPAYPEVMRKFAGAFCDWAHGKLKGGHKAVEACWDDIADALAEGPVKEKVTAAAGAAPAKGKPAVAKTAKAKATPKKAKAAKPAKPHQKPKQSKPKQAKAPKVKSSKK